MIHFLLNQTLIKRAKCSGQKWKEPISINSFLVPILGLVCQPLATNEKKENEKKKDHFDFEALVDRIIPPALQGREKAVDRAEFLGQWDRMHV